MRCFQRLGLGEEEAAARANSQTPSVPRGRGLLWALESLTQGVRTPGATDSALRL